MNSREKTIKSLVELEKIARQATRDALSAYKIPDKIREELILGIFFDGNERIFELYVPGKKPADAIVVSRAKVDAVTGKVNVDVFL